MLSMCLSYNEFYHALIFPLMPWLSLLGIHLSSIGCINYLYYPCDHIKVKCNYRIKLFFSHFHFFFHILVVHMAEIICWDRLGLLGICVGILDVCNMGDCICNPRSDASQSICSLRLWIWNTRGTRILCIS